MSGYRNSHFPSLRAALRLTWYATVYVAMFFALLNLREVMLAVRDAYRWLDALLRSWGVL